MISKRNDENCSNFTFLLCVEIFKINFQSAWTFCFFPRDFVKRSSVKKPQKILLTMFILCKITEISSREHFHAVKLTSNLIKSHSFKIATKNSKPINSCDGKSSLTLMITSFYILHSLRRDCQIWWCFFIFIMCTRQLIVAAALRSEGEKNKQDKTNYETSKMNSQQVMEMRESMCCLTSVECPREEFV